MKKIFSVFLLTIVAFAGYAQQGSIANTVFKSRVDGGAITRDTTNVAFTGAIATAVADGWGYIYWNKQATHPHWDFYTTTGIKHVFSFGGGGGGHVIEDEGTPLIQRTNLNFAGAGVTATDAGGKTLITIPGGGGGSVTSVSSANSDATVANPTTTPAITIVSAPKITTARNIAATGDVGYTVSFDGSTNVTAAATLATVNSNVGSFGSATQSTTATVDGKGRITAISAQTVTPAVGSITGLGTGVATALAINVGSAGAPVINGGALGTPSSGVGTNITGVLGTNVTNTAAGGISATTAQAAINELDTEKKSSALTASALTDGSAITITGPKHTLTTTQSAITFSDSYTGDFLNVDVTFNNTSATWTFPTGSLCVIEGAASGDNTATIAGVSGDKIVISIWFVNTNVYRVAIKNFGQ